MSQFQPHIQFEINVYNLPSTNALSVETRDMQKLFPLRIETYLRSASDAKISVSWFSCSLILQTSGLSYIVRSDSTPQMSCRTELIHFLDILTLTSFRALSRV
jgi:hypothetical protein